MRCGKGRRKSNVGIDKKEYVVVVGHFATWSGNSVEGIGDLVQRQFSDLDETAGTDPIVLLDTQAKIAK